MATEGKLEKMLIMGFKDSKKAENGGQREAMDNGAYYEAFINPESYIIESKLKFAASDQGHGNSGKQLKYQYSEPEELTFDFLFDDTGIIEDLRKHNDSNGAKPNKIDVADDIKKFKTILTKYQGDIHEPFFYKLVWGKNSIYIGRVTEISITYKLFKPDGSPIRAVAKVKFKSSIEDIKRAGKENKSSPDLTHFRTVKAGDTLPLMCQRIYGNPKYYLQVAAINNIGNFRRLTPGLEILFPPIEKKAVS
jgi:Contractile injection system tube protein